MEINIEKIKLAILIITRCAIDQVADHQVEWKYKIDALNKSIDQLAALRLVFENTPADHYLDSAFAEIKTAVDQLKEKA